MTMTHRLSQPEPSTARAAAPDKRQGKLAFADLGGAEARTLIVCTPPGFERYFDRLAAEQAGVEPPPEASEGDPGDDRGRLARRRPSEGRAVISKRRAAQ